MAVITIDDGTQIYYKDWGNGQPIVFSHPWSLSADAWDAQMFFFGQHGYRVIAHDRRSHGRSDQTWDGNDMDTYADDLASLLEALELDNVVLVGHGMGGGEVTRYLRRHRTARVRKAVLISTLLPHTQAAGKPDGIQVEALDAVGRRLIANRAQFFRDLSFPFYGSSGADADVWQGARDVFWLQCMEAGIKGVYDGIMQFATADFTDDLGKVDVPTLLIHGDNDQLVPVAASATVATLVPQATLKMYPGAPHGLTVTHQDQLNADLLAFISEERMGTNGEDL